MGIPGKNPFPAWIFSDCAPNPIVSEVVDVPCVAGDAAAVTAEAAALTALALALDMYVTNCAIQSFINAGQVVTY
jgi:hypothetical protein